MSVKKHRISLLKHSAAEQPGPWTDSLFTERELSSPTYSANSAGSYMALRVNPSESLSPRDICKMEMKNFDIRERRIDS